MALRLMQNFVPEINDTNLDGLLEGRDVLGRWRDTDAGQIVLHLLVPAEETEPIMDRFEQHFSDAKGFHVKLRQYCLGPSQRRRMMKKRLSPKRKPKRKKLNESAEKNSMRRLAKDSAFLVCSLA